MQKTLRKGKVLIDWSQNDEHKTTVNVYSLRAKATPTVSTPLQWSEVSPWPKKAMRPAGIRERGGAEAREEARRPVRAFVNAEAAPAEPPQIGFYLRRRSKSVFLRELIHLTLLRRLVRRQRSNSAPWRKRLPVA